MRFQPTPRQIIALKAFVFVACLLPVARLVALFLRDGLGANPIEVITLTSAPAARSTWRGCTGDVAITALSITFTVTKDMVITANFR